MTRRVWLGILLLGLIALTLLRIALAWPGSVGEWFVHPDALPLELAVVQVSLFPEMAVAVLAGGLLGMASSALQHVVRNTLAADTTLAVGSGAQLSLMLVTLFFPAVAFYGAFWGAFAGALCALVLVLIVAQRMEPLAILLAGMIVNLFFNAAAALFSLFYVEELRGVMVWGSGTLVQDGWTTARALSISAVLVALPFAILHRPLALLSLDDDQARRLGAPVLALRYGVLLLVAAVVAQVVSRIGIVGFVGLAGASAANFLHVRHFSARLLVSFAAGALLLLMVSHLVFVLDFCFATVLPAGALTGILGAPFLLWLVLRTRKDAGVASASGQTARLERLSSWRIPLFACLALLLLFAVLQGFAAGVHGWGFSTDMAHILQFRLPRSLSALATGAMLACGGVILQTLTRNPMAAPEVLGVSSGAALAVVATFFFFPGVGSMTLLGAGVAGSAAVLLIILWLSQRMQPAWLLITGIAIAALVQSVNSMMQISGDPRLQAVLSWLSGSTYRSNPHTAWILLCAALLLCSSAWFMARALQMLSLGTVMAGAIGLHVRRAQGILLLLVALMSAAATLAVGPLSFIGLMSPHLARRMGAVTPQQQFPVAALTGGGIMLLADWLGRYLIFPYEIPAGVLASILGGGYFLLLSRQRHAI